MAATPEQKRRQKRIHRTAVRIIRTTHPLLWAHAYQQARQQIDNNEPETL